MNSLQEVTSQFDARPYLRAAVNGVKRSSWLSPLEGALVFYYSPSPATGPTYIVKTQAPYAIEQIQRRIGATVDGRFGDATRRGIIARMRAAGQNVPDSEPVGPSMLAFALVDTFFGNGAVGFPSPMDMPNVGTAPRAAGNSTYFAIMDTMGRNVGLQRGPDGRVVVQPAAPSAPVPPPPQPQVTAPVTQSSQTSVATTTSSTTQTLAQPQAPAQNFVPGQPVPVPPGTPSQFTQTPGQPAQPQPAVFVGPTAPGQCPSNFVLLPTGQCQSTGSLTLAELQALIAQRVAQGLPFNGIEITGFADFYAAQGHPQTADTLRNLVREKYQGDKPLAEPVVLTQVEVERASIPMWAMPREYAYGPRPSSLLKFAAGALVLGAIVAVATKD